jgi:hypothetical protein
MESITGTTCQRWLPGSLYGGRPWMAARPFLEFNAVLNIVVSTSQTNLPTGDAFAASRGGDPRRSPLHTAFIRDGRSRQHVSSPTVIGGGTRRVKPFPSLPRSHRRTPLRATGRRTSPVSTPGSRGTIFASIGQYFFNRPAGPRHGARRTLYLRRPQWIQKREASLPK